MVRGIKASLSHSLSSRGFVLPVFCNCLLLLLVLPFFVLEQDKNEEYKQQYFGVCGCFPLSTRSENKPFFFCAFTFRSICFFNFIPGSGGCVHTRMPSQNTVLRDKKRPRVLSGPLGSSAIATRAATETTRGWEGLVESGGREGVFWCKAQSGSGLGRCVCVCVCVCVGR